MIVVAFKQMAQDLIQTYDGKFYRAIKDFVIRTDLYFLHSYRKLHTHIV